jgi:hypothetical protein
MTGKSPLMMCGLISDASADAILCVLQACTDAAKDVERYGRYPAIACSAFE